MAVDMGSEIERLDIFFITKFFQFKDRSLYLSHTLDKCNF